MRRGCGWGYRVACLRGLDATARRAGAGRGGGDSGRGIAGGGPPTGAAAAGRMRRGLCRAARAGATNFGAGTLCNPGPRPFSAAVVAAAAAAADSLWRSTGPFKTACLPRPGPAGPVRAGRSSRVVRPCGPALALPSFGQHCRPLLPHRRYKRRIGHRQHRRCRRFPMRSSLLVHNASHCSFTYRRNSVETRQGPCC